MVTKRREIEPPDVDENGVQFLPDARQDAQDLLPSDADIAADEDQLEQLLADMPRSHNSAVSIYRLGANRKHSFLFSTVPGEITFPALLAKLRDEYEGGDFRVHGRAGGKLVFNEFVSVEAPKKKPVSEFDIEAMVRQRIEGNRSPSNDIAMLASTLQQGFLELGKLIVNNAPRVNESDLEERFMNRMLQMKSLFQPEKPVDNSIGIETFLKGVEFSRTLADGAAEATEMSVLKEAIQTVGPVIMQAMAQPKVSATAPITRPPQLAPRPVAVPGVAIPSMQTMDAQLDENMKALMGWYINRLVKAAAAESDPYAYAVQILDEFDEAKIREFITNDGAFDRIVALVPEAANYRQWFIDLKVEIQDTLDGPFEDSPESVQDSGTGDKPV